MADNLPAPDTPRFPLADHALITLEGPEAMAFAQAQFANDVIALSPGHWQWSAWLTPKGRTIALFALLKLAEDRLWLLLPDYPAADFAEQLRRFVFRRKLKIGLREDLAVFGAFTAPEAARHSSLSGAGDDWQLDFGNASDPRTVCIAPILPPAAADIDNLARWRAHDVAHGIPRLEASQREQWTPQQLSLDRLHAYSVKKGCYPGQEIVARTHFLGKAKRGLALFSAHHPLSPGDEVMASGNATGTIVSTAETHGEYLALAVLPLERDATVPLASGDAALHGLPLRDGLQR